MSRFANGYRIKVSARTFAQNFALGFSGPLLLLQPLPGPRALQPGETIGRAWDSVGRHLNRAAQQVEREQRSKRSL